MQPARPISLSTPRLGIRPLSLDDLDAFVAYRQDPAVARYQGWDPSFTISDGEALILSQPEEALPPAGGWLQLALLGEDGVLVGDVAVHTIEEQPDAYEIGVTLAPAHQGAGLAGEAVAAVIHHLLTGAGAARVVAVCDARNAPIARVLQRAGMRKEGSEVDAEFFKGEWITLDTYALSPADSPAD